VYMRGGLIFLIFALSSFSSFGIALLGQDNSLFIVNRLSASLILACLAEGMSAEEIEESYGPFPHEAIPEVLKAASELLDTPHVAA